MWCIKFWNCLLSLSSIVWISFGVIKYKPTSWIECLQSNLLNWCVVIYWTNLLLRNIWFSHFLSGTNHTEGYIMSTRVYMMYTLKDSNITLSSDYFIKIHFWKLYSNAILFFCLLLIYIYKVIIWSPSSLQKG